MRKFLKGILTITFIFIMAIVLTGCGNNENGETNNGGNKSGENSKTFPTANFIPSYAKYDGNGNIVVATKNESSISKNVVI